MNPFLILLLDGTAYFIGLGLVVVGILAQGLTAENPRGKWLGRLVLVGVALVAGGAPPTPVWLTTAWAVAALGGGLALSRPQLRRGGRIGIVAGVAVFSLALAAMELPYRQSPSLHLAPGETIYVIGDSISAGLAEGEKTWPAYLQDLTRHPVVNLAEAGATLESARTQAASVSTSATCVILEIGGNDLLGKKPVGEFEANLERLVAQVGESGGRRLVMFELPLPPLQGDYGRAQRTVAARHGVALIPKRVFAAILGMANGTADSLHFTPAGQQAMAESLRGMIR